MTVPRFPGEGPPQEAVFRLLHGKPAAGVLAVALKSRKPLSFVYYPHFHLKFYAKFFCPLILTPL